MKHSDIFYRMDSEDFQNLRTITELVYTAKTLYRNVSELHSLICRSQDRNISELSLNAVLTFNKLFDALQIEQKMILNDIGIDISETT